MTSQPSVEDYTLEDTIVLPYMQRQLIDNQLGYSLSAFAVTELLDTRDTNGGFSLGCSLWVFSLVALTEVLDTRETNGGFSLVLLVSDSALRVAEREESKQFYQ